MMILTLKAFAVWLMIAIIAIGNGVLREKLLAPALGPGVSLPLSGLLLTIFIFLAAFLSMPFLGIKQRQDSFLLGVIWFVLTLAFEFGFGHFVAGKTWHEIMQVFTVTKGNLFILALLATLLAPWGAAKLRGLL